MGWRDAPIVKGAPEALQQPVKTTELPGFRSDVVSAETRARGTFRDVTRKGAGGKLIFGQENTVTGEFKPYPKEMQPQTAIPLTPQELADARDDALRRAAIAKGLEKSSREDWFSTGFLAPTFSQFGGTPAATVVQDIEALKAGGALNALLDMAKKAGKNLLTPLSNSDVQLLSNAKQFPLDIKQSDEKFQQNAVRYQEAAKNAFLAAGGTEKQFATQLARLTGRANAGAAKNAGVKVERVR